MTPTAPATSRERLVAALEGGRPDRVPVTLYEMSHLCEGRWHGVEPSYEPLLELQRQWGDSFVPTPANLLRLTGDPNTVTWAQETEGQSRLSRRTIRTPRGELTELRRRDPDQVTSWQIEPLVKDEEDCLRFLSLPVEPEEVDPEPVLRAQQRCGDEGLVIVGPGDPLGHVAGLFHYDAFCLMLLRREDLILAMLQAVFERLRAGLEQLCAAVSGVAVRFWGPEYAGPPLLDPGRYFRPLVVDFLAPLVELVNASGNYSVVHCHGRLDAILEPIAEMNPHALEPLEVLPAATADVTMEQVKRRVGDRLCLMGGMQANELENRDPAYVEARVRELFDAAKPGGRYVLLPTATPINVPLAERVVENYRAYFRAAREYGEYE